MSIAVRQCLFCTAHVVFVDHLFCVLYYLRCVGERNERGRILDDNAHIRGHGRRHANSYDSISSQGNFEYLLPLFLENREHVAKKQEGAPDFFLA